jgi:hypothetical protein
MILSNNMEKNILLFLLALPLLLTSCATPRPPVAFHKTDDTMLVIESLDGRTGRILQPAASVVEPNDLLLARAHSLQQHQTAVVILENYTEPWLGEQFRDRGPQWFAGLRELGYEHIYFLRGQGVPDPEGLPTIVQYE